MPAPSTPGAPARRLALLTGSPGAVLDAVSAELARAGWDPLPVSIRADGGPAQAPAAADAVIHLGIRTPRDLDERRRAEAEASAASGAARLAGAVGARRLVHLSTCAVYGRPRNLPCREGELKAPRTAYERIRWQAERASWAAHRAGAPLTVLRPSLLYGPTLRGGPVRALALVALFNQRKARVPIIRRGPVAHLCHLEDLARATVHVVAHPDDAAVVGRAFNVADEAPLPLAELLETALLALGYQPGRFLPSFPRLTALVLWLFRHVPDRALLDPVNRRLVSAWRRFARAQPGTLVPRVDREALHWMSADHYYDVSRLAEIGFRHRFPVSTEILPETIRTLVSSRLLPGTGGSAFPTW
ncbi:MAG: NAD-dependent epimerase/dehydratase family protein [Anaeromyxobacter sp.]|nr:NAD-dependent epimerase/dehydratase family protein [Anaeromyxobacter sp.]